MEKNTLKQRTSMYQIKKTRDYRLFKPLIGNREVKKGALNKLIDAIKADNQLNLHPIIVNGEMCVIDGQHRLKAAESLNLDVYYIQSSDVSDFHFISGNLNQKELTTLNYINFYALREKRAEYIKFKNMLEESKITTKALLHLILGEVSIETIQSLRKGDFSFPTDPQYLEIYEKYLQFVSFAKEKRIKPFNMFKSYHFTIAFRWLVLTTNFQLEVFFKKLENRWYEIKPQANSKEWYKIMINIHNWKNTNKLEPEYALES